MPTHYLLPDRPFLSYEEYVHETGGRPMAEIRARPASDLLLEVQRSGLRGRGGAGFPTGAKWAALMTHPCPTRFAVMNAAEGEPGTFKDRWLLRRNPYAPLEGLLLGAFAVGASEAFVAIKHSFRPEIARVREALAQMEAAGVLEGVRVAVVEGPEEYLFGEEKALLNVIDEGDPFPRPVEQPPYEWGLRATLLSPNPALVNNVETYGRVATIARAGGASFRALGTRDTPGPILVTVSGDIREPGVYEIEAGIPIAGILEILGGGARQGRLIKAVLPGVSAAVLGKELLGTPADFGSMGRVGSGLGSAGFIAIDDRTSMARVAQAVARFLYVESCDQCSACKAGLATASRALDALCHEGSEDLDLLVRVIAGSRSAPQANRCYLPVQGATLIPSLVSRFGEEMVPGARDFPRWPIPKMIDFDEAAGAFVYDEEQERKQPDWSYAAADETPAPGP